MAYWLYSWASVYFMPDDTDSRLPAAPCSRCGSTDMRTIKIPRTRAFWSWLVDGTSTGGTHEECARCGLGRVSHTFTARLRRETPLGIPWRFLRTLHDHRSREPVPVLYVEVLVAGTVVGIVLDARTRIPWWSPPLVAIGGTWLYYLASAFSGPRGVSLDRDLKVALRPGRAAEFHQADTEKAFREAPFPLLGLDESWTGERWLGGFATSNGETTELHLGHSRDTPDGTLRVVVGVQNANHAPTGENDSDLTRAALNLARELTRRPWSPGDDNGSSPRLAPSSPLAISVDGYAVAFRSWREGERWVAVGRSGDRIISVDARGIEPQLVSLRTVTNLEAYVAGARQRRGRRWQTHNDH